MFEGVKKFYRNHKVEILIVGGGAVAAAGIVLGKKIFDNDYLLIKNNVLDEVGHAPYLQDRDEAHKYLESIGGEFIRDSCYATKEVATRFMEEKGQTYQLTILSPEESAIWISPFAKPE